MAYLLRGRSITIRPTRLNQQTLVQHLPPKTPRMESAAAARLSLLTTLLSTSSLMTMGSSKFRRTPSDRLTRPTQLFWPMLTSSCDHTTKNLSLQHLADTTRTRLFRSAWLPCRPTPGSTTYPKSSLKDLASKMRYSLAAAFPSVKTVALLWIQTSLSSRHKKRKPKVLKEVKYRRLARTTTQFSTLTPNSPSSLFRRLNNSRRLLAVWQCPMQA